LYPSGLALQPKKRGGKTIKSGAVAMQNRKYVSYLILGVDGAEKAPGAIGAGIVGSREKQTPGVIAQCFQHGL